MGEVARLAGEVLDNTLFDWVPVEIFAAPYTRPVRQWQVERLRRGWSIKKVGTIYVSLRPDGRFAVRRRGFSTRRSCPRGSTST